MTTHYRIIINDEVKGQNTLVIVCDIVQGQTSVRFAQLSIKIIEKLIRAFLLILLSLNVYNNLYSVNLSFTITHQKL